ncbi:MAG: hypothetical protein JWP59_516, partial [Massilia sp.]|nr:hypothetical protein [Massilia sp.]
MCNRSKSAMCAALLRLLYFVAGISCSAPALAQQAPYPPLPGEPAAPTAQEARYMTAGEAANAAYGFAMQAQNPDSDKLVDTT